MKQLRYIIEPMFIFYYTGLLLQMPVIQQYIYSWYSKEYGLEYHYDTQSNSCHTGKYNSSEMALEKNVQSKVSRFYAGLALCQNIPCIITLLFYGSLSDIVGRKPIMVVTTAMSTIYLIISSITVWLELNIKFIYIGAFFDGLGGSYPGLVMSGTAYLADLTKKDKLSLRLAIFESAVLVSLATSFYTSGIFIAKYSFAIPEVFITCLISLSFLWALFVLKESLNFSLPDTEKKKLNFKTIIIMPAKLLASWKRQYVHRHALSLVILSLSFSSIFLIPLLSLVTLYLLNSPLCFSATSNGYYIGTLLVTLSVSSALGVKLCLRFLPAPMVVLISFGFGSAYYFLLAFSHEIKLLYSGLVLRSFSLLHVPILRSLVSSMVITTDRGSIFSIMACLDQIFILLLTQIFNYLYIKINQSGYFFLVPGSLYIIPSILIIIYWVITSTKKDDKLLLIVSET
ncbi:lysosomal proton-coupled steroid conjugate and bile acid symporter SLC46A3 isoform X1 [Hydra vulgaris]|uniref:lysosomal proton-coupled steroid conjugate and bile acid symporter SLC46A3 isoform X1 n=1 Tax=Hydra vulgaris TaxID=6087 RepID=UPI001F5E93AB|nr:solute carrier family 46 member 3 [Hydra vulgaris]